MESIGIRRAAKGKEGRGRQEWCARVVLVCPNGRNPLQQARQRKLTMPVQIVIQLLAESLGIMQELQSGEIGSGADAGDLLRTLLQ